MAQTRRGFGSVDQLPSKRWRARYYGPDLRMHLAPFTYDTKADAEGWLATERQLIINGKWSPPKGRQAERVAEIVAATVAAELTFGQYAEGWLTRRTVRGRPLAVRTREHYRKLLDVHLLPNWRDRPLKSITVSDVAAWQYLVSMRTGPTMSAHAYSLFRAICSTAFAEDLIESNPCRVRGAGNVARTVKIRPATVAELDAIAAAMPEHLSLAVLLAGWCSTRWGELFELRRADVRLAHADKADPTKDAPVSGVLAISRGVVRTKGALVVSGPKTMSSVRDVAIPPHLLPAVVAHLRTHVGSEPDALLFPGRGGGHLAYSSLMSHFYPARDSAGRPDLRWHDLRHSGATLAAAAGATLADNMRRLGHSTVDAATRYMHAAQGADALLAERLSELARVASTDKA